MIKTHSFELQPKPFCLMHFLNLVKLKLVCFEMFPTESSCVRVSIARVTMSAIPPTKARSVTLIQSQIHHESSGVRCFEVHT